MRRGVDDIWGRNGTPTNATYRRGRGKGRQDTKRG